MVLELIDFRPGCAEPAALLRYGLAKRYRGGPVLGASWLARDANRSREIIIVTQRRSLFLPEHLST